MSFSLSQRNQPSETPEQTNTPTSSPIPTEIPEPETTLVPKTPTPVRVIGAGDRPTTAVLDTLTPTTVSPTPEIAAVEQESNGRFVYEVGLLIAAVSLGIGYFLYRTRKAILSILTGDIQK